MKEKDERRRGELREERSEKEKQKQKERNASSKKEPNTFV